MERGTQGLDRLYSDFHVLLETFFRDSVYSKPGPKIDELMKRKGYLSYVMVTGSSGAGKTTQVKTVTIGSHSHITEWEESMFSTNSIYYTTAKRYITRKARSSDEMTDFDENHHVTQAEFMRLVENGTIEIFRKRDLGSEEVFYGFESNRHISGEIAKKRRKAKSILGTDGPNRVRLPEQGGIIVYSGNNDMARNFGNIPFCINHQKEFVHIHVQAADNTERFAKRSADVALGDTQQFMKRASDDGDDVATQSHIIVNNIYDKQDAIKEEIKYFFSILAAYNQTVERYNPQYTTDEIVRCINPGFSR